MNMYIRATQTKPSVYVPVNATSAELVTMAANTIKSNMPSHDPISTLSVSWYFKTNNNCAILQTVKLIRTNKQYFHDITLIYL